jgi:apolipoprotein N-acyltransferase
MKKILIVLLSALIVTSCTKEESISQENATLSFRSFGSVYGVDDYAEAKERFGEYTIFGVVPNGGVTVRAKAKAFDPNRNSVYLNASFMPDKTQRSNRIDAGDFFINREKFEFQEVGYMPSNLNESERIEFTENLFGQELSISLEQGGQTVVSSNFRAPVLLTQFDVVNSSPVSPAVDVKWISIEESVTINWNADPLNENGLVLVLTSQGDKYNAPKAGPKDTHLMATFIEEDDGEYTIPHDFFQNLTEEQLINLTLYRGKFDYIQDDGQGYDYKFYAMQRMGQHISRIKFYGLFFAASILLFLPLAQIDFFDLIAPFYISAIAILFAGFSQRVRIAGTYVSLLIYNAVNLIWLFNTPFDFQIVLLIALLSFFYSIPLFFLHQRQYLLFVSLWLSIDYVLLHTKISFPLLSLSHHVAFYPDLIQFVKIFGALGVNLFILVLNILIVSLIDFNRSKRAALLSSVIIIIFQSLNLILLHHYPVKEDGNNLTVLALNTSLECPEEKYSKSAEELLNIYRSKVAKAKKSKDINLVILPETAFDSLSYVNKITSNKILSKLKNEAPKSAYIVGTILYSSAHWYSNKLPNGFNESGIHRFFFLNSTAFISKDKIQLRHKNKLVPFNEYIPNEIAWFIPNSEIISFRDFRNVDEQTMPFTNGRMNVGAGICYESLFGEFISKFVLNGANLIAFQYNEGWYHSLYGSRKMLAHACLRANEQNKFVVGSSNCGFSSIINNKGEIEMIQSGGIDLIGDVTLNQKVTPYTYLGDFIGWLSMLTLCIHLLARTNTFLGS